MSFLFGVALTAAVWFYSTTDSGKALWAKIKAKLPGSTPPDAAA